MGTFGPEGAPLAGLAASARADATVVRMLLGNQLRRFREAAGVTPDQAGYEIRASRWKINRMENGRVSFKERDITDLLTMYGVTDSQLRAGTLDLVRRANAPGWLAEYGDIVPDWSEAYLGLEASASIIRTCELQFVHGLFQTQDYARAITVHGDRAAPREEIERRVGLRMRRQELLAGDDPPRVWSVMDEAALRRVVGGRSVMRAQLGRLTELAALPHVTLQVVPLGTGYAGSTFTILRFDELDLPDVVYIEQLTSALYLDARADVDSYMEVMERLSAQALPPAATEAFINKVIAQT